MRRLNTNRDFGTTLPPYLEPNCDRATAYEQDGYRFDAHGREIIPGQPLSDSIVDQPVATGSLVQEDDDYTPVELLQLQNSLPWSAFHAAAKKILPNCPASKEPVVAELQKLVAGYEKHQLKRQSRKGAARAAPQADVGVDGDPPADDPVPQKAAAPPAAGEVDLAAWGRGQKEYRFSEVRKALRRKFSVQIQGPQERQDAVALLIKEGVISMAEARPDT